MRHELGDRRLRDRIARRYDLMNRLMTFGRDIAWRRFVVKEAALPRGGHLLDRREVKAGGYFDIDWK